MQAVKDMLQPQQSDLKDLIDSAQTDYTPAVWNNLLNKGTSFSERERTEWKLRGLIPSTIESLDNQARRIEWQIRQLKEPIQKYDLMRYLAQCNQKLYYKVLIDNVTELMPVVYTPTVGQGCQEFSKRYIQPYGLFVNGYRDRGHFKEIINNWPSNDARIIVVTDGGRILGLGDLGLNGMGISQGKIALYVAAGGFNPYVSIPAVLDVGTDRKEVLDDEFYLGERKSRLKGDELLQIVGEFLEAVKARWPKCVVQFEDFNTESAFAILHTFREKYTCFNDDIQGTAGIALAGFINGMRIQNADLSKARMLFYGAGSSAIGIGQLIAKYVSMETGTSYEDAKKNYYFMDSKGLIHDYRGDQLAEHKKEFSRKEGDLKNAGQMKEILDIIKYCKPNAIIGLTGGGPAFKQDHIEEMCKYNEKPLVFSLSNPTSKSEITAEQAIYWSKGKAIFAGGSPFDPVEYEGRKIIPGQGNNAFVFPGLGLGAAMMETQTVSDELIIAAGKAVAYSVPNSYFKEGRIYPDIEHIREITKKVAAQVAQAVVDLKLTKKQPPSNYEKFIDGLMWHPQKIESD